MNILMVTNVFTPQIGGVTRSIQQFSEEYRRQGHRVLTIAPEYEKHPAGERDVIRVSAIPRFYLDQYSLPLPMMASLLPAIEEFQPDIVHVHHPFLLGSTGQRIAVAQGIPLVYTHHTRYSVYIESKTQIPRPIEEGIVELITGFCNLADGVVAPSEGIAQMLRDRGVTSEINVIPTGVDVDRYGKGDRAAFRNSLGLSSDQFVIGHVGRLSTEKNCEFLCHAVIDYLKSDPTAYFVVVGDGPKKEEMQSKFQSAGLENQFHFSGFLEGEHLVNAYCGFDLFAFASHSETQGMVLAEAMAAGAPVVAVDGTGVRDILIEGHNGRMIDHDDQSAFVEAIRSIRTADDETRQQLRQGALETAQRHSQQVCASQMLQFYEQLCNENVPQRTSEWEQLQQKWDASWQLWQNRARAVATAAYEVIAGSYDYSPDERETGV